MRLANPDQGAVAATTVFEQPGAVRSPSLIRLASLLCAVVPHRISHWHCKRRHSCTTLSPSFRASGTSNNLNAFCEDNDDIEKSACMWEEQRIPFDTSIEFDLALGSHPPSAKPLSGGPRSDLGAKVDMAFGSRGPRVGVPSSIHLNI